MPDAAGDDVEFAGADLVYATPAPTPRRQILLLRLYDALRPLLAARGRGVLLVASVGVEFPDTREGVQPDLLFVSGERLGIIGDASLRGAPDLVVEITSPSTAGRDRTIKLEPYERQGVPEYWIVDPDEGVVDV